MSKAVKAYKWRPGEKPPAPMTEEMMLKAYRKLVDAGVVKHGEEVWIATTKQKGRLRKQQQKRENTE